MDALQAITLPAMPRAAGSTKKGAGALFTLSNSSVSSSGVRKLSRPDRPHPPAW